MPYIVSAGPLRAFQGGTLVAALAYTLTALSCLPAGALRLRRLLQYAASVVVLFSFPQACNPSLKDRPLTDSLVRASPSPLTSTDADETVNGRRR